MLDERMKGVDLAALNTLRLVFRRKSFTAAAEELNVKQATVSYTIGRLRTVFSDQLFVRQGNRIWPTSRCTEIVEAAERVLADMSQLAFPTEFDPAVARAKVTISATYLSRSFFMPTIIRQLRQEAPGVSIEMITGFADAGDQLISGRADIAFSPVRIEQNGISGEFLFGDHYVCLMDTRNPLAKASITVDEFAAASHLFIHYGQTWLPLYRRSLNERGLDINVAVSTPEPEDVRLFIPNTDLVVALPSKIAMQFSDGLHMCPCPITADVEIKMCWPARLNTSPLHDWIRSKARRLATQLGKNYGLD